MWGSLKNFVSNGFGAISDFIVSSIVDPLKSIFSDSKDDAKETAEKQRAGIIEDTEKRREELQKTEEEAEAAKDEISELSNQTKAAREVEKNQNVSLYFSKGKSFDEKALKQSAANNAMETFLKRYNIDADEEERKRYQDIFEKHIQVQNGQAKFNMQEISAELKKQAEIDSDDQWYDTKLVDTLQDLEANDLSDLSGDIEQGIRDYMEKTGGNVSQNAAAPGMDKEALANNIPPEQTEFAATQELIIQSVSALQTSMESFDNNIIQTFTNLFDGFVDKFIKALKVDVKITTPRHIDTKNYKYDDYDTVEVSNEQTINDYSPTMVNVIPIAKKSFEIMNDKISNLVEESVKIIQSQNKLLMDIKEVIGLKGVQSSHNSPTIINTASSPKSDNNLQGGNSQIAASLVADLWSSTNHFIA